MKTPCIRARVGCYLIKIIPGNCSRCGNVYLISQSEVIVMLVFVCLWVGVRVRRYDELSEVMHF